jgi:phosphotransferase system enzyme I (PtsP)
LQALAAVAEAARAEGQLVSICGELAGDPMAAILLMAMGYDVLSMNSTSLPRVKKAVRSFAHAEALSLLDEISSLEDSGAIQQRLQEVLVERGLTQFIHNPMD